MVDRRVQLRQELLQQNFLNVVQALRVENDPDLNVQLDTFVKKICNVTMIRAHPV